MAQDLKEGIPSQLKDINHVYYVNASHGQLANDKIFRYSFHFKYTGTTYLSKDPETLSRNTLHNPYTKSIEVQLNSPTMPKS